MFARPVGAAVLAVLLTAPLAPAQTIGPQFAGSYTLHDRGSVPGLPAAYGGLTFRQGQPNQLLIGGNANANEAAIYGVGVTRGGDGRVTGFSGSATVVASAPRIDGGLAYGPAGVLFATTFSDNQLLQFKPGSTAPDKVIDLSSLGVSASTGSVTFVPAGFPDAGGIRILSYSAGEIFSGTLTADGSGTFDLSGVQLRATTGNGPEGMAYVPAGSPVFTAPSVVISEYNAGQVAAYTLDANGFPIPDTRRVFVDGLAGAEGAAIDGPTGDFFFSTFGGGDRVIQVVGFAPVPEPAGVLLGCAAAAGVFGTCRRFFLSARAGRRHF